MITKFSQYHGILEGTDDLHSFVNMLKEPAKMFYDDLRDQMMRYVDNIVEESQYQNLTYPGGYYMVFTYKDKMFKMQLTSGAQSVRCYLVIQKPEKFSSYADQFGPKDGGVYKNIGSMSTSVGILFKKIDKFLKTNV